MAEALARRYFVPLDEQRIEIGSAGLAVADDGPASTGAVGAMGELGGDLTQHRSRSLDPDILSRADLVLTMTRAHRDEIQKRFPGSEDKVITLAQFSGLTDKGDVADPYGGPLEQYQRTAHEIEEHLLAAVPLVRQRLRELGANRSTG